MVMYVPPSFKVHHFLSKAIVAKNHALQAAHVQQSGASKNGQLLHAKELYLFFRRSNRAAIFAGQIDDGARQRLAAAAVKYTFTLRLKVQS
ncbi:hypothetical protein NHJ13734_001675 [Beauveria thailandica]